MARIPISRILRKSPFDGLLKHANKVTECMGHLQKGIIAYLDGDFEKALEAQKQVSETEHEADLIKGNIRAHLPKNILMPVDIRVFLLLLKEQDALLDYAEDSIEWLTLREKPVPEEIKEPMKEHLAKVIEAVEGLENVVSHTHELVTASLPGNLRERTKEAIKKVHRLEWEADKIERELCRKLFKLEIDAKTLFHLLKVIHLVDQIANHAENAGDRIRAMIAK